MLFIVASREVFHPEEIQMTTLSEVVTPITQRASVESSDESNISGSIPGATSYNMPKPHYVNQHMVNPVYTHLYSSIEDENRHSSMVRQVCCQSGFATGDADV